MKTISIILFQLISLGSIISQSYEDKRGNEQLWGRVELNQLMKGDYADWYQENLKDFKTELCSEDGVLLKDVEVKIFIGTWCGDTKYLLPKFIKSWEAMELGHSQLEMIAVHNSDELYKQGPAKETQGYNIHRVPTFVFEKNGEEIGRIVERTVFDLDTDIKTIANGHSYEQRYKAVTLLDKFIYKIDSDSLNTKSSINECFKLVRREVSTVSELNTYGYVLIAEGKLDLAELVLRLNRYLFPFHPNARDSYGEILYKNGKLEEAKEQYLEAIRINPNNDNAVKQLALINEEMAI